MVDEIYSADDDSDSDEPIYRCPHCDSVVQKGATRCLMCGTTLGEEVFQQTTEPTKAPIPAIFLRQQAAAEAAERQKATESEPEPEPEPVSKTEAEMAPDPIPVMPPPLPIASEFEAEPEPVSAEPDNQATTPQTNPTPVFRHIPEVIDDFNPAPVRPQAPKPTKPASFRLFPEENTQAPLAILIALFVLFTLCVGSFAFFRPGSMPGVALVFTPTSTNTSTAVPSNTPVVFPTETSTATPEITNTPTVTPTPLPTETPQPPRAHAVTSGQTAVGISVLYGFDSFGPIFELNDFNESTILFEGQEILIPWPTATPPLQAIAVAVGEETIVVDPANCPPFYEIKEGDNLFQLAAESGVPLDAMLAINYRTIDSILKPGDVICIPEVTTGPLPPTPGPSPTPSLTPSPRGPELLYPADGVAVPTSDQPFALQWLTVKDLAANEWYMVELIDLTDNDAHPLRGFTRTNAFRVPLEWRPNDNGARHQFQWQVTIIQVTGERSDGRFTYTYGGRTSTPKTFFWQSQ